MSSFPQHVKNISDLGTMGFDVSGCLEEDGQVSMDSWSYDDLVDTFSEVIDILKRQGFEVMKTKS